MRAQAGFTLAELVIVLMLIGILAAVAVPRLSGSTIDQFSARGTRDFVGAALRYAQKSAIAMRRNVCVTVSATELSATYALSAGADQSCDPIYAPSSTIPTNAIRNPGNDLAYSHTKNRFDTRSPVSASASVIFDAQGRPLSALSTPRTTALTISVTGHANPITVEPETGTVR